MRVLKSKRFFVTVITLVVFSAMFSPIGYPQEKQNETIIEATMKPDPLRKEKSAQQSEQIAESPDTNFTYEKYADFLTRISDSSKYVVLPIDEFRKRIDTNKIIIGLRHDVDNDLKLAQRFSLTEKKLGFRSTYYILHTADYYLAKPENKAIHTDSILPILKDMQNNSHFEIGWHNDLVTLQVVYNIDPVNFLHQELAWLRSNGLKITGSASHGSNYCKVYGYLNYYFFEECTWPVGGQYVNNVTVPVGNSIITLKKGRFSDFGLEYEAYFLNNNKYYSDASFINGQRWSIGMLDLNTLKKGDRVIILLHPIHWHPGSVMADIKSFAVAGQKSSSINPNNSSVSIVMPYGASLHNLTPTFTLSPGAYAKVLNSMQTSGTSHVNFTNPVIYKVYAENRNVTKDWTVSVTNAWNTATNIESFTFPGVTKKVVIDPLRKTIVARVFSSAILGSLVSDFRLSYGAVAYVGNTLQISNSTRNDFTTPVTYKIVAEDGVTASHWKISAEMLNDKAEFISFVLPGMTKPATIDTRLKTIDVEVSGNQPLTQIPALFEISSNARAYIDGVEQVSGLSVNNFQNPLTYTIVSEDSLTIIQWAISVKQQVLDDTKNEETNPSLKVYPNPARNKAVIALRNITDKASTIEMFNSQGVRVYSTELKNASSLSWEIDITGFTPGIYIIKCSSVSKPVRFIIK